MIVCKSANKQVPSGNNENCIHFKAFKPQDFLAVGKHLAYLACLRLCLSLYETEGTGPFLSDK